MTTTGVVRNVPARSPRSETPLVESSGTALMAQALCLHFPPAPQATVFSCAGLLVLFLLLAIAVTLFLRTFVAQLRRRTARDARLICDLEIQASVFRFAVEAITITDANANILSVNQAFTRITGYTLDDVRGKNPRILQSGRHDRAFYKAMWRDIEQNGTWEGEIWNRRKDGSVYPERLSIHAVPGPGGNTTGYVAHFIDLTREKLNEERIRQREEHDPVTALPNRRVLGGRLREREQVAAPAGAILWINLDRFSWINQAFGYERGDQLLNDVARCLARSVGKDDFVAHLGGDDFAVFAANCPDRAMAGRIAENLVKILAGCFSLRIPVVRTSASIGVSLYPDDARDSEELLLKASQAMNAAKRLGGNCWSFVHAGEQPAVRRRELVLGGLRTAIAHDEIYAVYQPIVNLATGQIEKAEALLRWESPRLGPVSPGEFIPLAEETGWIAPLSNWGFQQVLLLLDDWQHRYPWFQVSINLSPAELARDHQRPLRWLEHLRHHGIAPHHIAIEITEGVLLSADPETEETLRLLRQASVTLAIDDFGTGYASLSCLSRLNTSLIKIDRCFVANITRSRTEAVICETIIEMAHKLGGKVVAEGVETEEQLALLTALGCDYGQGFWFSRPVRAAELERLMQQQFPLRRAAAAPGRV